MKLKSWGNHPNFKALKKLSSLNEINKSQSNNIIAQGNHRSYGDSAFAETIVEMRQRDMFLSFDEQKGLLECQSGVLFKDILETTVPKGWIIPVLPGTQLITVGGAIASDVHGKNHHLHGCISQFVKSFNLIIADGSILECSPNKNTDLYHATFGGMGLTGIILDAKISLKPIGSTQIIQKTIKSENLKQTLQIFEENMKSTYAVAWFDCYSESIGKGLIYLGEHQTQASKSLNYKYQFKFKIPFNLPFFLLNKWSLKVFNKLYFKKARETTKNVDMQSFFFPLDHIKDWNKIYGKKGFVQYQCVLPLDLSEKGLTEILKIIRSSGQGSFLAVLKRMGKENNNYLSFPMQGYTLALDFKINKDIYSLLDKLDEIVAEHHGRIYLCKDSRTHHKHMQTFYPKLSKFLNIRSKYKLDEKFNSSQSKRLKL